MIIHFHFHSRATGITRTVESIVPILNKYSGSFVFGYGIKAPKISWISLLRLIYSDRKLVIHTHRNIEILFALFLRKMRGKFKLIFTRHSDGKPAKLSCLLMKKADHLVTLNSTMAENIPYPNTLIKHGVNIDIFKIHKKQKIANIHQKNLISIIGRIRPPKGQIVVLRTLTAILRNNSDWGLVMIGKIDDKKYAEEIMSMASENGIASQVYIMPESNKIIDYYFASNIIVIASFTEGFSLVCLEAMACGLITVATESVGIHSKVINHGENGFLFPKNDHEYLRKILTDIISGKINLDPDKIRQTVIDKWSLERSVKDLLKLYEISQVN